MCCRSLYSGSGTISVASTPVAFAATIIDQEISARGADTSERLCGGEQLLSRARQGWLTCLPPPTRPYC
eukprot:3179433-Prymnesium_polylepis.1